VASVFPPDLLDAIERLPTRALDADVWRHTFGDNDPGQANTGGARWNPRGVDALYASLERETAIAEGDYRVQLEPLRPRTKRVVHRVRVRLKNVVDLANETALATVGLTPADLGDLRMEKTRAVGGAAEWLGRDGILVPSLRADGANLVIFPNQMEADGLFEPISAEVIVDPASSEKS
jgi:RES domain-containing protein